MARVAGVNLPNQKKIEVALGYIFGIGRVVAKRILQATGIDGTIKAKDLTESQVATLNTYIEENLKVEGDLRREVQANIKRLREIGSYRGIRHRRNLPVHGQRTRTNARIRRGSRKTVGAAKAVPQKSAGEAKK